MKRFLFLALCFYIFTIPVLAEQKSYDFRNINWGMSINEVSKSEKQPPVEQAEDALLYKVKISSYNCDLVYFFVDNKLYKAVYFFTESHINNFNYINDFYTIKEMLDKKYTPYTEDVEKWHGDPGYQIDKGLAVALDYLSYIAKWNTEAANITLLLYNYKNQPSMILQYESIALKSLVEEKREEENLSNL